MSCYFCFVFLPLGPEKWRVWCCILVCFVLPCQWICLFCVFDSVRELFSEIIHNMFGCVCHFLVECDVIGGAQLDRPVWSSIECACCACCACGPCERVDAPSICFVCVFV